MSGALTPTREREILAGIRSELWATTTLSGLASDVLKIEKRQRGALAAALVELERRGYVQGAELDGHRFAIPWPERKVRPVKDAYWIRLTYEGEARLALLESKALGPSEREEAMTIEELRTELQDVIDSATAALAEAESAEGYIDSANDLEDEDPAEAQNDRERAAEALRSISTDLNGPKPLAEIVTAANALASEISGGVVA